MAPHRTLWIRAGGTVTFLLIAGVVAARLLTGSPHPILWNDQELTPLDNSTAATAAVHSSARPFDARPGVANVTVTVDPIAPAASDNDHDADDVAGPAAGIWSNKGPLWGKGHFAKLTSTSGHKGKGGGGGHAGTAGTGGLSRVPKGDKHSSPSVHHGGGGGSTTIVAAGPAVTDPTASLLFSTDTTLPTTPTGGGIGELGGALGASGGLSLTPEPTSMLLTATGLLGLFGAFARRTRQR